MTRVEATDGSTLTATQLNAALSPLAMLQIRERWRVCDPLVIDTAAAAGASLSHVRCWELASGASAAVCSLILEDDACMTKELSDGQAIPNERGVACFCRTPVGGCGCSEQAPCRTNKNDGVCRHMNQNGI